MARRRKSRSVLLGVGKAVVLLGAFGLAYALFALLGLQLALESREVAVPDLTNLSPEEASATVAAADLALRIEAIRRVDQSIAAGRVADQDPGPGVVTRRGRSVKIWLSSGLIPVAEASGSAIGTMMENVPYDVPVANDMPAPSKKIRAGRVPCGRKSPTNPVTKRPVPSC